MGLDIEAVPCPASRLGDSSAYPGTRLLTLYVGFALAISLLSRPLSCSGPLAPVALSDDARRRRTCHRPGGSALAAAPPRRPPGRRDLPGRCRSPTSSRRFRRTTASRPRHRGVGDVLQPGTFSAAARCWDSAPPNKWTADEMRRDANQIRQSDHFGFMLDTFDDRRNGYVFYANPLGGRIDLTEADEGNSNPTGIPCGKFEPRVRGRLDD